MYSDWEPRSSAAGTGVGGGLDVTEMDEAKRRLGLKDPLAEQTNAILSGALVRGEPVESPLSDVPGASLCPRYLDMLRLP